MASLASARASGLVSSCTEASLRAALFGGGVVTFSNDCAITISQLIVISQAETTIDANGHNVTISGGNATALFDVSTNLTLRGLNLINGASPSAGAALYIRSDAVVIANGCLFAGNSVKAANGHSGDNGTTTDTTGTDGSAGMPGASALGGAIYNQGTLALGKCTFTTNSATAGSGGSGGSGGAGNGAFQLGGNGGDGGQGGAALGGAVYNLGDLTLMNCTFSTNSALGGNGGAGGTAGTGTNPGTPGNGGAGASGLGGAVYNSGNLTVLASTFSVNSALGGASATNGLKGNLSGKTGIKGGQASAGAVYNAWWAALTNCTFYTNSALGGTGGNGGNGSGTFEVPGDGGDGGDGVGGALYNLNTATVVNCTFSSSGAVGGTNGLPGTGKFTGVPGHFGASEGANIATTGPIFILMNSILAAAVSEPNAFGSFTDAGYNLSSDSVGSFGSLSFQNTDPKLSPLADNGGPTFTMAIAPNSPAVDKIPSSASPSTDQRGVPRPINGLSDIGAFEFGGSITVTNVTLSISATTNNSIQLSVTGATGLTFFVQASTNLSNWKTVSTNVAPFVFTDTVTNFPARFYQITR
jgi:hypothetical protein